jgi:hypothetical protein
MINQRNDTSHSIGTILFFVLCLLCISAFSNTSVNQTSHSIQHVFLNEFPSNHVTAIILRDVEIPSQQKSCLSIRYNTNYNLFDESHKIAADNRTLNQKIILLHKTQLLIKPLPLCRFYFHRFLSDTEEPPILS